MYIGLGEYRKWCAGGICAATGGTGKREPENGNKQHTLTILTQRQELRAHLNR